TLHRPLPSRRRRRGTGRGSLRESGQGLRWDEIEERSWRAGVPAGSIRRVTDDLRAKAGRGLALFDLDGTLIAWDTQMLFCDHVLHQEGLRRAYLPFFAAFLPVAGILGDEGMKRVFLSYLWRADREEILAWAREFAAVWFPSRCYPEMLERLRRHREAGHLTVLASASPEFYVREVGRALGFD